MLGGWKDRCRIVLHSLLAMSPGTPAAERWLLQAKPSLVVGTPAPCKQ